MRALAYFGKNDVRVVDKPIPRIEHPEDAIVRVTTTAICGSDLHLYHGLVPDTRIGHTFGHEIVGIVQEVGPDVRRLKPGDRVVVPFPIACGRCFYCTQGLWTACESSNPYSELGGIFGYSHTTGGYDGGHAEYVRVPFADTGPRVVPEQLSDEQAVMLADAFPTGYFGADIASIRPGDTVAVFGCGPVGLFAQYAAKHFFHAGRVLAIDHVPYRLQHAEAYCGAEPIDFSQVDDIIQHLKDITGGRGPDVAIDCVGLEASGSLPQTVSGALFLQAGSATALGWAMNCVRPGGTVSVLGVYGPPFNNLLPIGWAMNRNLSIKMGQCPVHQYIDQLMDRTLRNEIDPAFIVTHTLGLEAAPLGYELFEQKRDRAIKVLLRPTNGYH